MNDEAFLQRIFNGDVQCYRQHNWHQSANCSDMTAAELGFFTTLGNHLGFSVRREMNWNYPRDLCWCENPSGSTDAEAGTVLYLERENDDARVLGNTIDKMTDPKNSGSTRYLIPYLVAVLGWVRPTTLREAKAKIRLRLRPGQHFLLISWIGQTWDDDGFVIEGWVHRQGQNTSWVRMAKPERDAAGYWYAYFKDSPERVPTVDDLV